MSQNGDDIILLQYSWNIDLPRPFPFSWETWIVHGMGEMVTIPGMVAIRGMVTIRDIAAIRGMVTIGGIVTIRGQESSSTTGLHLAPTLCREGTTLGQP